MLCYAIIVVDSPEWTAAFIPNVMSASQGGCPRGYRYILAGPDELGVTRPSKKLKILFCIPSSYMVKHTRSRYNLVPSHYRDRPGATVKFTRDATYDSRPNTRYQYRLNGANLFSFSLFSRLAKQRQSKQQIGVAESRHTT